MTIPYRSTADLMFTGPGHAKIVLDEVKGQVSLGPWAGKNQKTNVWSQMIFSSHKGHSVDDGMILEMLPN